MNKIQTEDCRLIGKQEFIKWEELRNKTVLITGSTGLIGSNLVNILAYNSIHKGLNIQFILPVRNTEAANKMFSWTNAQIFSYSLGDRILSDKPADYIVHLASPTSSRFFSENPSETILMNVEGITALLDWAKGHPVQKFIDLSSMEVYGFPQKGHKVKENELGSFETMNARNSYPIAKLSGEALCYSYFSQYHVPAVVLRATQTFGPGVRYDDNRVFAQFMRCVIEKKNIILKSHGLTERPYLYTADAASAIIVAMLKGVPGEAYSVANRATYISIRDMANMVAEKIAKKQITVEYEIEENVEKLGYASTLYLDLDTTKMEILQWKPLVGLKEMYERMIEGIEKTV